MNLITKVLIGLGIGGGTFAGWRYFSRLKKAFDGLEIISDLKLHKVTLEGIELRLDLTLKNPSSQSLKLKFPFIKIFYQDKVVGTSQVVNKDIKVPPHGEARIEKIMIRMPLPGLLNIGAAVAASLNTGVPVDLKVLTQTTVDTGVNQVPHESISKVTLNS